MLLDLEKIKEELKTLPNYKDQICLQGTKDNLDPFYGIGAEIFNNTGRREIEFDVPIFDLPYINSIIKDLNMYRTRVITLRPKTCYTYHQDTTKRIHIPVITNDKCFFIINKQVKHYPADGNYYVVDTTQNHTALNASKQDRIHIIGVI